MIAMKSCSSCGEERPREAFSAKQWKAKAHGRRCAEKGETSLLAHGQTGRPEPGERADRDRASPALAY